ncbi:MAG TPA: aminopeptidase P family protein [Paracoccaceae bacterium]|nr:aminopeptidase P family protein [Paracoccaceae bacterium]
MPGRIFCHHLAKLAGLAPWPGFGQFPGEEHREGRPGMLQDFKPGQGAADSGARVARLRETCADQGITGFMVPRADAYQGENVAPRDERLAWLTGFTGSAGIAIVLEERAAIFVDGRYSVQARQQVDESVFEIVPLHLTPPADWLAEALTGNERIGYDPWLHGKAEIEKIREAVERRGETLVPLDRNLVDAIWSDQPPPPMGAVRVHKLELAGESAAEKRARIGKAVADLGAETAILSLPESISWLLNIRGSDVAHSPVAQGVAVVSRNGQVDLVMEPGKLGDEVRAHLGNEVTLHAPDRLPRLIAGLQGPVLLDKTSCPLWFAERLEAAGTEIIWGADPVMRAKMRKNAAELAGMRAAHLRDGAVMARFLHWFDTEIATGRTLTEIGIAERLEVMRRATGRLLDISFDTISAAGPNAALPHYRVNRDSNRTLHAGELMLVDSGAQYDDGTTDITRTFAAGAISDEHRRHFTLVLKGMIALSRARFPQGIKGRELDSLARIALWRAGFDYDHGTGHGVGACLNVHEGPVSLSRRGETALEPGMILSNEPGFYREGSHGIRIENLLIVTEPSVPEGGERPMLGFETLTWCPIDRRLIDKDLLDTESRAWLDAYHAEVLERVGPLVEPEVREWLETACAPL